MCREVHGCSRDVSTRLQHLGELFHLLMETLLVANFDYPR